MEGYEPKPASPQTWGDVEMLFGSKGACGGCWCMMWRLPRVEYEASKGDANRENFRRMILAGKEPGVLLYEGAEPVAWAAVGPRSAFPRLANSRILAPTDDVAAWCVPCLFIEKRHRGRGLGSILARAAADHAFRRGAEVVEAYPHDLLPGQRLPPPFVWTGLVTSFAAAGFIEVARRSARRPIMRLYKGSPSDPNSLVKLR